MIQHGIFGVTLDEQNAKVGRDNSRRINHLASVDPTRKTYVGGQQVNMAADLRILSALAPSAASITV